MATWLRMAAFAAAATLTLRSAPPGGNPRSTSSRPPAPSESSGAVNGVRLPPISPVVVDVSRLASSAHAAGPGEEDKGVEVLVRRLLPHELPVPRGANVRLARRMAAAPRASLPAAPAPGTQFDSLGDDGTTTPPDTDGAVGPSHVVTMLNTAMRIQNRSGAQIRDVALSEFWGSGSDHLSDPVVLYDAPAGRWVATILTIPEQPLKVLVAVSQSDDPTGAWNLYSALPAPSGAFPDFPRLGLSANRVVVEVNSYDRSGFRGSAVLIFDKAALYRGDQTSPTLIQSPSLGPTLVPSVTQEPDRTEVFLLQDYNGRASEGGLLRLYALTGELGSESLQPIAFPGAPERWAPVFEPDSDRGPQKGSSYALDTVDSRIGNVVLRRGFLWAVHTIFDPPENPTRGLVQWWQIALDGSVADHGRLEEETGGVLAFPSIAVNRDDHVLVGFAIFSPLAYPSGGYAYRSAADSPGELRGPVVLKSGEDTFVWLRSTDQRNRWGDFSTTLTDPVDDTAFWTIQEYSAPRTPDPPYPTPKSHWGTWWGAIEPETPSQPTAHFETGSENFAGWPLGFRDASEGGPTEWVWSFGDGTSSSERDPAKAYAAPGTYVVSLTASNRAGSSTETQSVTVAPAPTRSVPEPASPHERKPMSPPPRRGSADLLRSAPSERSRPSG